MASARIRLGAAAIALLAAMAPWMVLAETRTTGVSSTNGQLGPPLPVPGQPSPVPWQQRVLWLQQQLHVLGRDPGPSQDLFRQLAKQVDAVVAAAPGMNVEGEGAGWPVLPGTAAPPTSQPVGEAGQGQTASPGTPSGQQAAGGGEALSMGAGGSAGQEAAGQGAPAGQPPPRPLVGPEGKRPGGPQAPPAMGEAERKVLESFHLSRELEHLASNPMQVAILGVYAIADAAKDNPEQGISVLQALLEQEQAVPMRTVIRFALKDLYVKAGQKEAAMQQLQTLVRENSRLAGEMEQRTGQQGRPPGPHGERGGPAPSPPDGEPNRR